MRPFTLLLDMDGPLADFDRRFWEVCNDEGFTFDIASPAEQTARFFTDHIPDRSERTLARQLVDNSPWFRHLPITPGAQAGVHALLDLGIDLWVCTKPLEANRTCRDDKAAWLRQNFPMLEDRMVIAPNKGMIVADILLDDAPKVEWLELSLWRPVIFTAPFNGSGSAWGSLPRWSWADPIEDLFLDFERARLGLSSRAG